MNAVIAEERGGGAVSVPMALSILALFIVAGLAVDGVRAAHGVAHADAVAEEAARAAGQALNPEALARGTAAVDPDMAVRAAQAYLTAAGATGEVDLVGPDRIRAQVTTTRPTVLLGLIGQATITSHGSAEAVLVTVMPAGGTP